MTREEAVLEARRQLRLFEDYTRESAKADFQNSRYYDTAADNAYNRVVDLVSRLAGAAAEAEASLLARACA